uniref:Ig-like domain-containing protein n=1 Tax=Ciona savignyi TaxID=51511 RepID=H2YB73_CIOSA
AAIASLDIHKANDLPTLFRTLLQENTSLPVTATGFVIECSADLTSPESAHEGLDIRFEWSRDETPIAISSTKYLIQSREIRSALGHVRLLSSLRFVDIARGRDDATFRCQLVNTTTATGFVSSLE